MIPITIALIIGILLSDTLPGFGSLFLAFPIAVAAAAIMWRRSHRPARWMLLPAAAAAGYLFMAPWSAPVFGPDHIVNYLDAGYWRVGGTVAEPPLVRFGRTRLVLETKTLSRDGESQTVSGRIRLTVMGTIELVAGDQVSFPARIRSLRNFNNPGGFNYRRYMAFKKIHGSAWVRAEKIEIAGNRPQSPAVRIVHDLRRKLGRLIEAVDEEKFTDEKAVLKALIFGDRSGIERDLRERFNRSGAGHLLAISGLHVGIVAAVVFRSLLWLFSFCTPLLWRGWGRQWAAAATVLIVLAYGVLAGMSPSTQRAVTMVTVFLAALILGRTRDTLNPLAVAALVILLLFPPALFSISFQLSFAAVLAIVYGLERIGPAADPAHSTGRKSANWLAGFILVSALAIAGTTPIVLYHFNQTSLVGIAANLLLVPLVGFVVVPLGLVSATAAMFFEPAAGPAFRLCIQILHQALTVVDFFSSLPFAAVKTVTPSLPEIVLYYLIGGALLNLRRSGLALRVLAAALLLAGADGIYWSYQRFWRDDLRVTAMDVGQGGATLLQLPGGRVVLYDGGGFSDNRLFDMGQRVVAPQLWRRKIATVDVLILSHPNADHLNGLIYIANHFKVGELWINRDVHTTVGYKALMAACREKNIRIQRLIAGSPLPAFGKAALAVLHPPADFFRHPEAIDQEDRNDGSLVIRVAFGRTSFLLTGDIMAAAEATLVKSAGSDLASTVLFAPHHGSKTSSTPAFVAAVNPAAVVISAGARNRFGFPHAEVTDRYRAAGCRILCTCSHGAVSMRSDGSDVQIETFFDKVICKKACARE
jgi:competence protein ComEC